jgi:hypothetical protein
MDADMLHDQVAVHIYHIYISVKHVWEKSFKKDVIIFSGVLIGVGCVL